MRAWWFAELRAQQRDGFRARGPVQRRCRGTALLSAHSDPKSNYAVVGAKIAPGDLKELLLKFSPSLYSPHSQGKTLKVLKKMSRIGAAELTALKKP